MENEREIYEVSWAREVPSFEVFYEMSKKFCAFVVFYGSSCERGVR